MSVEPIVYEVTAAYNVADELLHQLALATATVNGQSFFNVLVEQVGQLLEAEQVFVAEVSDEQYNQAKTLANWRNEKISLNFQYNLEAYPCLRVVREGKILYYPNKLNSLFPAEGERQCYLGIPLMSSKGVVMGQFVILSLYPRHYDEATISALRIFANRAAAELERLRVERELIFSQEQFRTLFEAVPLGVVLYQAGKIRQWNPAIEGLFGLSENDFKSLKLSQLFAPEAKSEFLQAYKSVERGESLSEQLEIACINQDLGVFWVKLFIFSLRNNDQETLVLVFEDINQRRQAMQVLEERNRLARDLHDAVSQTLWSASLIADIIPKLWETDPEAAKVRLEQVKVLNRSALAEMRALLLDLRSHTFGDKQLGDLFRQLLESLQGRSAIKVNFEQQGEAFALEEVLQIGLYRIVQEALNNGLKHAQAQNIMLRLSYYQSALDIQVEDDGCGFAVEKNHFKGFGLKIIKERAQSVGATLSIYSKVNEGTKIHLSWKKGGIK